MLEIMPYIILILVIIALEWLQIYLSEHKIKKWILPTLSFLLSLFVIGICIAIEVNHTSPGTEKNKWYDVSVMDNLMMLPILNIPTLIFIVTNIIMEKINNKKKKQNNM